MTQFYSVFILKVEIKTLEFEFSSPPLNQGAEEKQVCRIFSVLLKKRKNNEIGSLGIPVTKMSHQHAPEWRVGKYLAE